MLRFYLALLCLVGAVYADYSLEFSAVPEFGSPPAARFGYAAASHAGDILVFGGAGEEKHYSDFFAFNTTSGTWRQLVSMENEPEERVFAAATVHDSEFYLFGGVDEHGSSLSDLWRYEFGSLRWAKLSDSISARGQGPSPRFWSSLFVVNETLYMYGGYCVDGFSTELWKVQPDAVSYFARDDIPNWPPANLTHIHYSVVVGDESEATQYFVVANGSYVEVYSVTFDPAGSPSTYTLLSSTPGATKPASRTKFGCDYESALHAIHISQGWSHVEHAYLSDVWTFDLDTATWTEQAVVGPSSSSTSVCASSSSSTESEPAWCKAAGARTSFTAVEVDGDVYEFGGYTPTALTNDLFIREADTGAVNVIHESSRAPPHRQRASLVRIGTSFYLYGGRDSGLDVAADVLELELGETEWEVRPVSSVVPVPRYDHTAVTIGTRMVVYGGTNERGDVLGDVWEFNAVNDVWTQLQPDPLSQPPARSGHTAVSLGDFMVVFGGFAPAGHYDDVWILDPIGAVWSAVSMSGTPPTGTHHCAATVVDLESGSPVIVVSGGVTAGGIEDQSMHGLYIDTAAATGEWVVIDSVAVDPGVSSHASVSLGNVVFSLFGGSYEFVSDAAHVSVLDSTDSSGSSPLIGATTLDVPVGGAVAPVYGIKHFAAGTYGSQLVVVGGVGTPDNGSPQGLDGHTLNTVYTVSAGPVCTGNAAATAASGAGTCVPCDRGFVEVNGNCSACPAGSYNSGYYSNECTQCRPGFYGPLEGADSDLACLPCPAGTYNDAFGAEECTACAGDESCPLGSVEPVPAKSLQLSSTIKSVQPVRTGQIPPDIWRRMIDMMIIVSAILVVIFILILIVFHFTRHRYAWFWEYMDFWFTAEHMVDYGQAILNQKTIYGGLFTMLTCVGIILMAMLVLIPTFYNNYDISRSDVAAVLADDVTFVGNFTIDVGVPLYTGSCEASKGVCVADITASANGITKNNSDSKTNLACRLRKGECQIQWTCELCKFDSTRNGVVSITVNEEDTFASNYKWSITTSTETNVAGHFSQLSGTLAADSGYVFRGKSVPSQITARAVPLNHRYINNGTRDTGFLVTYLDAATGSEVSQTTFHSENGFVFNVALAESETVVEIVVTNNLRLEVVLVAILGAVSAVFTYSATLMKTYEYWIIGFDDSPSIDCKGKEGVLVHTTGNKFTFVQQREWDGDINELLSEEENTTASVESGSRTSRGAKVAPAKYTASSGSSSSSYH